MRRLILFCVIIISQIINSQILFCQVPTNQDCLDAIPICQNVYSTTTSYTNTGNYPAEISTGISCLGAGEKNDVWYTFTVQQSGNLSFTITPNSSGDDYDWAVYNLTNNTCADILTNSALEVSCNFSATPGATGPNGNGSTNSQDASGENCNLVIPVTAGQTYVVNVSNYSSTQSGYTIDFGASTAVIFDNIPPSIHAITSAIGCGGNTITFDFSENILCSTIATCDITLTGPGGPYTITNITGTGCASGGTQEKTFTITFTPAITTSGSYNLNLNAAACNSVTDLCGNVATSGSLPFSIVAITTNTSTTNALCGQSNGSASVTASGGSGTYNYSWNTTPAQTSSTASNIPAGTYIVTVSDGSCSAIDTATVNNTGGPTVSMASTATTCGHSNGTATVTASGGSGNYLFSWSTAPVQTSQTATGLASGPYSVTVYDGTCTAIGNVTVAASNSITASITPNNPSICPGDPIALTASGGATSYSWSPNTNLSSTTGATVTASPTAMIVYTVTGTDGNGCTATASVTVNIVNNATVSISPVNPSICLNGSVTLTASGTTNYTWTPSAGLSATNVGTVTANPSVTTTYTVLGTSGGCSGTASVTVNVISISATATSTDENCGQANGTVVAFPSGNCTQSYSYSWSTIPVQTTVTATHQSAGTYTVSVYCGACMTTASATINNIAGPSVSISGITNTTCNQPNGGASATGSGGSAPYTYSWSNSYVGQNLTGVPSGTYTVTIKDANGCTATNSVIIPASTTPTSSVSAITSASCGMSDGGAVLNVSSGTTPYVFNWNSVPPQSTQNLQDVPTGNYIVIVTDANGCTCSSTVTVNEKPGPSVSASSVNEICDQANGTATAAGSGGLGTYTYLWSNGQTTPTATGLSEGPYTVTVNDGGCTSSTSVYVYETPGPTAGFSEHPAVLTLMDGPVNFQDNSSLGVVDWQWNYGDGSTGTGNTSQHQYNAIGTYLVTLIVTDNNGCMDTIMDSVMVKEIYTFYIPNAFSPDDDQFNDVFTPYGINVDPDNFKMYIFNRWGNMMFYTDKWILTHAEPWNGTLNNEGAYDQVVPDVYVYRILLKELDGPRHEYIGSITIVR